jgi:hypothetical protein
MIRKLLLITVLILSAIGCFGYIKATADSTQLQIGKETVITIETDGERVFADTKIGGFDNPDVLFDGIAVKNGKVSLIFLAPYKENVAYVKFTNSKKESTEVHITISDTKLAGEAVALKVTNIKGPSVYKDASSDIWNPLKKDMLISEGFEILNPKGAYVKLNGPQEINIELTENSQIIFETLQKSGDEIDFRYKVKKGLTYNTIDKKLLPGSKFIVSDNQSVVAGVRGTRFAFESGEKSIIRVFEGIVSLSLDDKALFADMNKMVVFDVFNKIADLKELDIKEDELIKELEPEEEIEPEKQPDKKKEDKTEKSGSTSDNKPAEEAVTSDLTNLNIGNVKKNGTDYFIYSFAPEFKFGFLKLGIGLNAYQKELNGTMYYGIPSATDSTDPLSAVTLNRLGIDLGFLNLDYGRSPYYTYALGMLANRYFVPNALVFDTAFNLYNISVWAHIPYELASFVPFSFNQSSPLFSAGIKLNAFDTIIDGTYIYESSVLTSKPFEHAAILSLYKTFLGIKFGAEADLLFGGSLKEKLAYGGFLGSFFDIPPFAQFSLGLSYSGDYFEPQLLGPLYERKRELQTIKLPEKPYGLGAVGNLSLNILNFASIDIGYKNYFLGEGLDVLSGTLAVSLKNIVGSMPDFTVGGAYLNKGLFTNGTLNIWDSDTFFEVYVFYPVIGTNGLKYKFYYDPETAKFTNSVIFESK